ncbi:MAG: glycerophosphoryl diester phosphodiesterase [Fusobacteriaceae bacterium]|jgi:glycerophosphoryl diester phosphodiesterase|nr:glycerophosphoryl diester phosphodiesterase [Fusobacteriaceae bacterium]
MKIFAHRGASGNAPQNTISAIKLALEEKSDGIEIDVQLTKDNKVVVFHDWDINKITNLQGEIGEYTLKELKQLDVGLCFSDKFKNERIPTLDEVLDIVPKDIILNIELKLKAYNTAPLVEKTAEILKKRNRYENILISSFNHKNLEKFNTILPEIKIALLYSANIINPIHYLNNFSMDIYSFNLDSNYINKEIINTLHKQNKKIFIWTVDNIKDAKLFMEMNVDGIMTNYPSLIKKTLNL